MCVELQVHSACLVCTCFKDLVFWRFLYTFWGLVKCPNARSVNQHNHFALFEFLEISKKGPGKSLKSP